MNDQHVSVSTASLGDSLGPPSTVLIDARGVRVQNVLTLIKAGPAEMLFEQIGLNKRESKDMVEALFDVIHEMFEQGDNVKLPDLGNFQLCNKPQRPSRNPKMGEAIPITARRVVTFHASQKLRAFVKEHVKPPSVDVA